MKKLMILVGAVALAAILSGCAKCCESEAMKMSSNGRNLFTAVKRANVERETRGLPNLWPHATEADGLSDEEEDIAGKKFQSATEYFKALFDIGGDRPYIDLHAEEYAMADGRPVWCVARGVSEEMPDGVPVMVSANFDCSRLPRRWTGSGPDADQKIAVGSIGKMGDYGIVVVYKGGIVKIIPDAEVTLRSILGNDPIPMLPASWLTPDGAVESK